jgi:hypothetical protein
MSHQRRSVGGKGWLALGAFVLMASLVACGDNASRVWSDRTTWRPSAHDQTTAVRLLVTDGFGAP